MHDIYKLLLEDSYHLNIPMPVVSITELDLHVQKGEILNGQFEIYNSEDGCFAAVIESINNYINIKNTVLKGNNLVVDYEVNLISSHYNEAYEDTIIITYNGGEILIPVSITIEHIQPKRSPKGYLPKKEIKKFTITTNQMSYHVDETGILRFSNPTGKKLLITLEHAEGYIVFGEPKFEILEEKEVTFNFKISKIDRILGKIPLKTHPKIQLNLNIVVGDGINETIYQHPIYLTELEALPTNVKISCQKVFQDKLYKLMNEYTMTLLYNTKNKLSDRYLEEFKALINYDKTNIDLRLFYCYLAIELNKKDWVLREVNNIDRFLIYYDNENLEVSDLLLLFVEMVKGESVQSLVSRWYPKNEKSFFKILLKNRLMTHNHSSYSDYKALYELGVRSRFLFTDAVNFLNSSPLIPLGEDVFYKAMLTWAIRKKNIGTRWLKKIENNFELLIQNNNINLYIAQQLYEIDSNKNMLTLLTSYYLKMNEQDYKSLMIIEKALSERIRLEGLEIAYIKAAYECNHLLNIGCLKMNVRVDYLQEPYQSFFLLNVLINKERYKHLYYFYKPALDSMKITCFNSNLIPEDGEEKIIYIEYLLKTRQFDCLINLYRNDCLYDLNDNLLLKIAHELCDTHSQEAFNIALFCYRNGINHEWIIQILAYGFKGSIGQLIAFNKLLLDNGKHSEHLLEEIILKGIITRKYPEIIMDIYVKYYNTNFEKVYNQGILTTPKESSNGIIEIERLSLHQLAQDYIAAQILIEDIQPTPSLITLLEDIVERKENVSLYLALLKAYIKSPHKKQILINQLIKKLVSKEIIFSWYLQLVPKSLLGERVRIQHYFEYNSKPGRSLIFNYRFDDDEEFMQIMMKHVALGLYIVSVVMFYNEGIQYYIEEISPDGTRDIKSSDIYINKEVTDQDEYETLFDLINTIEMSKELNDSISMEKSVARYIMMCNKQIENMSIL